MKILIALSIAAALSGCGPETMMEAGLPVHMDGGNPCKSSVQSHEWAQYCWNKMTNNRTGAPIGSSQGGD